MDINLIRKSEAVITAEQQEQLKAASIDVFKCEDGLGDEELFERAMNTFNTLGKELGIITFDPITTLNAMKVQPGEIFKVASVTDVMLASIVEDHTAEEELRALLNV